MSHFLNWSIGLQFNRVAGQVGSQVKSGRESGQVDSYFSNKFFFFLK